MGIIKKKDSTKLILKQFEDLVSVCNVDHLRYCNCQETRIKKVYKELFDKKYYDEQPDKWLKDKYIDYIMNKSRECVGIHCSNNNIRCLKEQQEIKLTIGMFNEKYDLNDVTVYMTIKPVISHQLSLFRLQQYSNSKGILEEVKDNYGSSRMLVTDIEKCKRQFADSQIKAMEILEKTINGSKTNISIDFNDPIDLDSLPDLGNGTKFVDAN